jgi:hypothetical protein
MEKEFIVLTAEMPYCRIKFIPDSLKKLLLEHPEVFITDTHICMILEEPNGLQ